MRTRKALSIVEVLGAMVLLASTASALLLAQGRTTSQLSSLREQALGARLAEELVAQWKLDNQRNWITTNESGDFVAHSGWRWERVVRTPELVQTISATEITLRVVHRQPSGEERRVAQYVWLERRDEKRQ